MSVIQADGQEEVVQNMLPSNVLQLRSYKRARVYGIPKTESKEEKEARQLAERKAHNEKVTRDYKLKRE